MMEEIPEERDIKVENESQRSAKDRQKEKEGDPEGSPEQRDQFVKFANSEEAKVKDYKQAENKFNVFQSRHQDEEEESEIRSIHFEVKTEEEYEDKIVQERAVTYQHVERVMKQEEKDEKEAL